MKGELELKRADFEFLTVGVYYDVEEAVILIRADEVLQEVFGPGSLHSDQEDRDVLLHSVMSGVWDALAAQGRRVHWISVDCRPAARYAEGTGGAG